MVKLFCSLFKEHDIFFYHSDHLGSTSYVTDAKGAATQWVVYMPYGGGLADQHSTSAEMPWKFNAKELDAETGLYYYGARYYEPGLAVWYGVDALFEKYPSLGGYVYCAGNPVRRIDIYGLGPVDRVKKARSLVGKPYKQETDSKLRTEETEAALAFLDCSELVCRVLADDGLTDGVKHMSSGAILKFLSNEDTFEKSDMPQIGDIAVWDGHVGIVSEVDGEKIRLIHARGSNKDSAENSTCVLPSVYRTSKFHGYFRPQKESNRQDDAVVYNGGVLPEVTIIGQSNTKISQTSE